MVVFITVAVWTGLSTIEEKKCKFPFFSLSLLFFSSGPRTCTHTKDDVNIYYDLTGWYNSIIFLWIPKRFIQFQSHHNAPQINTFQFQFALSVHTYTVPHIIIIQHIRLHLDKGIIYTFGMCVCVCALLLRHSYWIHFSPPFKPEIT